MEAGQESRKNQRTLSENNGFGLRIEAFDDALMAPIALEISP